MRDMNCCFVFLADIIKPVNKREIIGHECINQVEIVFYGHTLFTLFAYTFMNACNTTTSHYVHYKTVYARSNFNIDLLTLLT